MKPLRSGSSRSGSSSGFALIAVLWVTALLAALAAAAGSSSRTDAILARNQLESAKAEAMADGGIHFAINKMLTADKATALSSDNKIRQFAVGGGQVSIFIEDEDSKIDLNNAPLALIAGLFRATGVDTDLAWVLANRIGEFRDGYERSIVAGANKLDNRDARLFTGLTDQAFLVTDDLRSMINMPSDLYNKVAPYVTVYSRAKGVDLQFAPEMVLKNLPGMTPDIRQRLEAASPHKDLHHLIPWEALQTMEPYLVPSRQIFFTIRALAETAGGGRFVRKAVVQLKADSTRPFFVHEWQRGIWLPKFNSEG